MKDLQPLIMQAETTIDGFSAIPVKHAVQDILEDAGIHPAVAQDWENEYGRREKILNRSVEKMDVKRAGSPGAAYRRIIKSVVRAGRRWEYHATKGWRSTRLVV
jgi:hypothetical protein